MRCSGSATAISLPLPTVAIFPTQAHAEEIERVQVDLKVRVVDQGRPIASTWQIELRDGVNGWQVTDVLWRTLLGQRPPSRMP